MTYKNQQVPASRIRVTVTFPDGGRIVDTVALQAARDSKQRSQQIRAALNAMGEQYPNAASIHEGG